MIDADLRQPTRSSVPPQPARTPSKRRRKSRSGPKLSCVWFCLLSLQWAALTVLGMVFLRPHPLSTGDWIVAGLGGALALFYLWVACAVYGRKRYIFEIAVACAGLGLLSIPIGTFISLMLMSEMFASKHDFTKV